MDYVFQFRDVLNRWPLLVDGAMVTIAYSLAGMVVGLAIGIAGAVARRSRFLALRIVAAVYVETIRNTPLLVQLFIIYFALPSAGLRLSVGMAALVGIVVNNGAYMTEIVRAGMESVHPSQIEGGLSLGMSRLQVIRHIVLLPALANVYPALGSQFVLLLLSSSLLSSIGAQELTAHANFIQSETFRSFEVYIVTAAIYLALVAAFRLIFWLLSLVLFPYRAQAWRLR